MDINFYNLEKIKNSLESNGWSGSLEQVKDIIQVANNEAALNSFINLITNHFFETPKSVSDSIKAPYKNFCEFKNLAFVEFLKSLIVSDFENFDIVSYEIIPTQYGSDSFSIVMVTKDQNTNCTYELLDDDILVSRCVDGILLQFKYNLELFNLEFT